MKDPSRSITIVFRSVGTLAIGGGSVLFLPVTGATRGSATGLIFGTLAIGGGNILFFRGIGASICFATTGTAAIDIFSATAL